MRLDQARAAYVAHRSPRELSQHLTDELGIGQLAIARALGVTPTAVRKWKRGDAARPEHRDRLAQLAALCDRLLDLGLHDPAGWIEIPVSTASPITPLDLFTLGRPELAVLLATGATNPQETLTALDPDWRTKFIVDPDYEVVTLADGSRTAVPRRAPIPE